MNLKKLIDWMDIEQTLFLNLRFNLRFQERIYFYQKLNWTEIDFIIKREWKIFPIEAKTSNRDIIPKSFNSFLEKYIDEIWDFYKSTTSVNFIIIKKSYLKTFL